MGNDNDSNFDVFLCHNSADKPFVKEIGKKLKKAGIRPWLDEWELRPGLPWQDVLERQIETTPAVAVFVGENGLGPWQDEEQRAFIRQFKKRGCPVIPVILKDCTDDSDIPPFLEGMMNVDFRKDDPDPFKQLIWGITGEKGNITAISSEPPENKKSSKRAKKIKRSKEHPSSNGNQPSETSVILILALLIAGLLGLAYIFKDMFFTFLSTYSKDFGIFAIYAGFSAISLISAVVIYGVIRGAGLFRKTDKHGTYEIGGAMVGFLVMLCFLIVMHSFQTASSGVLKVIGNVRFMENGEPVGPVPHAKVALSNIPGFQTETDLNGNFTLELPENKKIQEVELQITVKDQTVYHTVPRSEIENVKVEIEKQAPEKPVTSTWTDSLTNMEFIRMPGGCYQMGCDKTDCFSYEGPVHEVCLDDFWVGKYEVTQGQWKKIMGNNPSAFQSGDDFPVESVSWNDAKEFIQGLNKRTGQKFRLPTEAEWEYVCKKNEDMESAFVNDLDRIAWHSFNSGGSTHSVGEKMCDNFKICDMLGNAWEWCEDGYAGDAYSKHQRSNPLIREGIGKVIRGGGWGYAPDDMRCSYRLGSPAEVGTKNIGFRLVRPDSD